MIQRGIKEGKIDGTEYEAFLDRLLGIEEQLDYDQLAREAEAAAYGEDFIPSEATPANVDAPFSIDKHPRQDVPEGKRPAAGASYSLGLSAIHNLTADNLAFADKMGGLAVPSIAVVPAGQPINGYGDITLIGGRPLADPQKVPVFDADAYMADWQR